MPFIEKDLIAYLITLAVAIFIALLEWHRYFFPSKPNPWAMTVLALGVTFYFSFKISHVIKHLHRLRLGRDGERSVGQDLEKLRKDGFQVFHDIITDKFNIDHVLLSPKGIYVLETKTWQKPTKGKANIHYDGKLLKIDGIIPERDPLSQAAALSDWLVNMLKESTGKNFLVRAFVLFPGWWVDLSKDAIKSRVLVLNPKMLPNFFTAAPDVLNEEDVNLAAFHLSRYIRTTENKNAL